MEIKYGEFGDLIERVINEWEDGYEVELDVGDKVALISDLTFCLFCQQDESGLKIIGDKEG